MRDLFAPPKSVLDGVAKGGFIGILLSSCLFPEVKEMPDNLHDLIEATNNNYYATALIIFLSVVGASWGAYNAQRDDHRPRP